jgi:hypothetical protein
VSAFYSPTEIRTDAQYLIAVRANENVYLLDAPLGKTFDTRESLIAVGADREFVFLYIYNFQLGHRLLFVATY